MKTSSYMVIFFLFLSIYTTKAQETASDEIKTVKEAVEPTEAVEKKEQVRSKKKKAPKVQQVQKLKERIESTSEKLEKERLGGELPGDYIAAKEAKITKMRLKLERMLTLSKTTKREVVSPSQDSLEETNTGQKD